MSKTSNPAAEETTVTVIADSDTRTEWDRFKDLAQHVVSVPKEAVKEGDQKD